MHIFITYSNTQNDDNHILTSHKNEDVTFLNVYKSFFISFPLPVKLKLFSSSAVLLNILARFIHEMNGSTYCMGIAPYAFYVQILIFHFSHTTYIRHNSIYGGLFYHLQLQIKKKILIILDHRTFLDMFMILFEN